MALIPTTGINESSPAGSDIIALGDNAIRAYKVQNREILEVDHTYPSSGQSATAGSHKKVTLIEQADLGTGATGIPILGAQTISGVAELVFTTEADVDIQMTKSGTLYPSQSTVLADWSKIMNLVYPIGSVVTLGVSTNPGTLFGVGTWTAIAGKVIVGIDGTQTEFDTLNETGGTKTHTLSSAEIPTTGIAAYVTSAVGSSNTDFASGDGTTNRRTNSGVVLGSGTAFSILQPYIVKYCWERTS